MEVPEEGMAQEAKPPPGIDPDAAFSVRVQFGQYIAKLDDGSRVHVPRKREEWVVDHRKCTLESLEKDLAARIKWGSCQRVIVSGYDASTGEDTELVDDMDLARKFFARRNERRLFLRVDVEDKPGVLVNSCVSEDNEVVSGEVVAARQGDAQDSKSQHVIDWDGLEIASIAQKQVPQHVIDWNILETDPTLEEQIGSPLPVMEDDGMCAFGGLKAEDERDEEARVKPEKARVETKSQRVGAAPPPTQDENAEVVINDVVPSEAEIFYDSEDPPMEVGSTYTTMVEFRSAVRQHAIKGQFKLGTEKSDKERFRGYCTAEGCPWAIVARLMHDGKSVTVNKFAHTCASTGRVNTKMASYHWVADKAIPLLKKDPSMGAKKLKEELESKHNVTIGYSTVWAGRRKAANKILGKKKESFANSVNFKAEIELKIPGNVVEIDVHEDDDDGQGSSKQMATPPRPAKATRTIALKKRKK
ncbi:uncharacterized protein LOC102707747 isoform X2 [Oryza brachyantha]|uniref:uncharacterized protein LOC102707747 isoform X2 n=1 Tax=Oryza brachyantha TaxID=4533 RepID=UPI00077663F4|nr:uncharacterized protein LOC102707747 isoform X2 [Oryza brachyantha]